MALVAIGLGGNAGDVAAAMRAAVCELRSLGAIVRVSSLYRTRPWGVADQPDFLNAAVLLETALAPRALLAALKRIERKLGRRTTYRWGPRAIDLDILTYGGLRVSESDLEIPHPRLAERAFALGPLSELDPAYRPLYQALPPVEREAAKLAGRVWTQGETVPLMPEENHQPAGTDPSLAARVRALARSLAQTELVRLRVEDENGDSIELRRAARIARAAPGEAGGDGRAPARLDAIKSDLVGIVHFSRPVPSEGERVEGDRELAYVEALGIRNPVRSLGAGRIAAINVRDGEAVEYGQVLFELDRG